MTRVTATTRRRATISCAATALTALAAPTGVNAATVSATVPPTGSFADLIEMVPAAAVMADAAMVMYTDMALHWERLGVGADEAARLDALTDLATPETFGMPPQLFANSSALVEESRAEVGFSAFDIERELAVLAPPRGLIIDVTTVSPEVIDSAIDSNSTWSDQANRVTTDHGTYVDWGAGTEMDPTRRSPLRPLGQAGQLAVLGDPATTVRTLDAADVEAVLASMSGDGESAASTPVVGPIAEVLGGEAVMQAIIVSGPNLFAPPLGASAEEIERILEQVVLVGPYLGVAVVEVADDGATRTEALLVHADGPSAEANAGFVETALAEGFDVNTMIPLAEMFPSATVSVDGAVVRVDVSGDRAFRQLHELLFRRALFPSG